MSYLHVCFLKQKSSLTFAGKALLKAITTFVLSIVEKNEIGASPSYFWSVHAYVVLSFIKVSNIGNFKLSDREYWANNLSKLVVSVLEESIILCNDKAVIRFPSPVNQVVKSLDISIEPEAAGNKGVTNSIKVVGSKTPQTSDNNKTIIIKINVKRDENTCNRAKNHQPIFVNHFQHLTFQAANIIVPISIAPASAIITE